MISPIPYVLSECLILSIWLAKAIAFLVLTISKSSVPSLYKQVANLKNVLPYLPTAPFFTFLTFSVNNLANTALNLTICFAFQSAAKGVLAVTLFLYNAICASSITEIAFCSVISVDALVIEANASFALVPTNFSATSAKAFLASSN